MTKEKVSVCEFNKEKMLRLKESDALIKFMVKDLVRRGHELNSALEIVFNSEVIYDTEMKKAYMLA